MLLWILLACRPTDAPDPPSSTTWDRGPNPHGMDDVLRWNHVQTKGTHNSYHLEPDVPLDPSHVYSHPTLTDQLELYDVRQVELDVHLTESGEWQVFHLAVLDEETTCLAFVDCLSELKAWSDGNGWHLPLMVWIEPKDELDGVADGLSLIDEASLLALDDAIREVWPEERLFRPDDLRGTHATLPDAVAEGWPTLETMRGRAVFALLDSGAHRERYLAPSDVLEGRVMFVDAGSPEDPFAALFKDGSDDQVGAWIDAGFVVTVNGSAAGDDDAEAEAADAGKLAAGAHHVATDLASPGDGYWFDLAPRCHPRTAPEDCDDAEVERLEP